MKKLSVYITATNSCYLSQQNSGLGNVLFQIASVFGIGRTYEIESSFPQLKELIGKLDLFGQNHKSTIFRNVAQYPIGDMTVISENPTKTMKYDQSLVNTILQSQNRPIEIRGFLGSYKYFHRYRDMILKIFSPDDESFKYIKRKYPELVCEKMKTTGAPEEISVSIHVRQMYVPGVKYTPHFYKKIIDIFESQYPHVHFYIFTDSVDWCEKNIVPLTKKYTVVKGNPDYIDLWMMSMCDHNIISHSTFSWWGAYLNQNGGKVIFSEDALRLSNGKLEKTPIHTFKLHEYFLPDWICLKNCTTIKNE